MSSVVVSLANLQLFLDSDAASKSCALWSLVLKRLGRLGGSSAILSPKRKKQLPKTKAANLEAHMWMVGASTFIQARAERLGNRCQSLTMEKSNDWNSEDGAVRGLSFGAGAGRACR